MAERRLPGPGSRGCSSHVPAPAIRTRTQLSSLLRVTSAVVCALRIYAVGEGRLSGRARHGRRTQGPILQRSQRPCSTQRPRQGSFRSSRGSRLAGPALTLGRAASPPSRRTVGLPHGILRARTCQRSRGGLAPSWALARSRAHRRSSDPRARVRRRRRHGEARTRRLAVYAYSARRSRR
jgi:hypothetical protein